LARMLPVIRAVLDKGQGAVMVKAALEVMEILPRRTVRLPLAAATELEAGYVREALAAAGIWPAAHPPAAAGGQSDGTHRAGGLLLTSPEGGPVVLDQWESRGRRH
ncbi:MAG: hypothetical protein LBH68_00135, partial [Bifidobacteriaceae bacterium]|nr:hypothetical protein [Bifidobacteriaceae bacterium]